MGFFLIVIFVVLLVVTFLAGKYCKKKLTMALSIIVLLISLWYIMLSIDKILVRSFREPIFVWETNNRSGLTANAIKYQGLGYKVITDIEYSEDGNIESESMTMYNMFGKEIADCRSEYINIDFQ